MPTEVRAELTGTVWKVEVAVGQAVSVGEVLAILESMKMEIPIDSPCSGTVASVAVSPGATVNEGDLIVIVE